VTPRLHRDEMTNFEPEAILRRNGRSMLAYQPGDAFWAIQAQLKAGTLKHLEARYQKPTRGSGELMSLYFY
jgi:hypothetical protein